MDETLAPANLGSLKTTEGVLAGVGDVEEPILVLVLLVDAAHQSGGWRQHLVDEDEDGLLGRKLDPLPDDVDELANREVGGDKIFLLVDSCDIGLFDLFADDRNAVGIFLADALGLRLSLLERMLVLELAAHFDWIDGTSCEAK